jgi:hypothetical protein
MTILGDPCESQSSSSCNIQISHLDLFYA